MSLDDFDRFVSEEIRRIKSKIFPSNGHVTSEIVAPAILQNKRGGALRPNPDGWMNKNRTVEYFWPDGRTEGPKMTTQPNNELV